MSLAQRGVSVLGMDAFHPPHTLGSHHGESRSVRRAYLEGSIYVPMALRAWELWRKLETDCGQRLLATTGNLTIGPPDGPALSGFVASAQAYDIPHEYLSAAEVRKRWPQLRPPDDFAAGLEIQAGIVFPERAVRAFCLAAEQSGAVLHFNERVTGWTTTGDAIDIHTTRGKYSAGRVVIAAGARGAPLIGASGPALMPKRVPVHWIEPPDPGAYALGQFPVNFWQVPIPDSAGASAAYHEFYTLPTITTTGRIKAAFHNRLADSDPEQPISAVSTAEVLAIRSVLKRYLPPLADQQIASHVCLYSLTPDDHFIIGHIPENDRIIAVALAGHGFKFAPVVGEMVSDLVQGRDPGFDINFFSPGRFSQHGSLTHKKADYHE
jgi:sarcosine oxidase